MQRRLVGKLVEMWPLAAWRAAGAISAKAWLFAYTDLGAGEITRLERAARVCAKDHRLATAVADGTLTVGRAARLGRLVTDERAPYLNEVVDPLLRLVRAGVSDDQYRTALARWAELVDQELAPRRVHPHTLVMTPRLFGGGEVHASLAPVAFQNFAAGLETFIQDPDPTDAPHQRTLSERRADALDDMAIYARTHQCNTDLDDDLDWQEQDDDGIDDAPAAGAADDHASAPGTAGGRADALVPWGCRMSAEDEDALAEDTHDGSFPGDTLDEALDPTNHGLDPLDLTRARLAKSIAHHHRRERRRTRPRSDARINVHIDLHTLTGLRDRTDLEGLVLHGDGWQLTHTVVEQLLCDTTLVATLFHGHRVLDANTDAERFTARQRRAIAARDRHCVFPSCRRPPKHCDTHHLTERARGGPTTVANGCLLCRHHHRLLHQQRWTLHQDDDGTWIATDPHGTEWPDPARRHRPTHPEAA